MSEKLDELRTALYGSSYDIKSFEIANMVGTDLPWAKIKIPHVKEVIKQYKNDDSLDLSEFPMEESVELTIVYFALSLLKRKTFVDQMDFLLEKVRFAKSWMITDIIQQYLKKSTRDDFAPYYEILIKGKHEYERRFAYIYAMKYYKDDITIFIDNIIFDDRYYIMMAQAWMLATFAITHFDLVYDYLKTSQVPLMLKRKAMSKMIDSFRISDEQKSAIRELRTEITK